MRVAIVDDEPLGRERVRSLLSTEAPDAIVTEYHDGEDAVRGMAESVPDILFLDVQMPGLDGFGVVDALGRVVNGDRLPVIVFVTAHDAFALKAFEVSATDYLLKPFDRPRFVEALKKAQARVSTNGHLHDGTTLSELVEHVRSLRAENDAIQAERARTDERFVVRLGARIYFVRAADIDWIEGDGNYARLHSSGKSHMVRETLKSIETRLDARCFVRIQRSTIINIDRIAVMEPHAHGEYRITMRDGSTLSSSRTHGARIRSLLK